MTRRVLAAAASRLRAIAACLRARFALVPTWPAVLRFAWSMRLMAIAAGLSGLETVLALYANDPPIPRGTFAIASFLTTAAAMWARLVAQTSTGTGDPK